MPQLKDVGGGLLIEEPGLRAAALTAFLSAATTFSLLIYWLNSQRFAFLEVSIFFLMTLFFIFMCTRFLFDQTVFIDSATKTIIWRWTFKNYKRERVRKISDFELVRLNRRSGKGGYRYELCIKNKNEEFHLATFSQYEEASMEGRRIVDAVGLPFEYLE